jgi:hypothetical protein
MKNLLFICAATLAVSAAAQTPTPQYQPKIPGRGLDVYPNMTSPTGYNGDTSYCGTSTAQSVLDYGAGYPGWIYSDNPLTADPTVKCQTPYLDDPTLTAPSPSLPINSAGINTLKPGTYQFPGTVNVPSYHIYQGLFDSQDNTNTTSTAGVVVEPATTGANTFALQPHGTQGGNALINLGCPPSTTGGCLAIGSVVRRLFLKGLGVPSLIGVSNYFTQQFGSIDHNQFVGFATCIRLGGYGTGGGAQNFSTVYQNSCQPEMPQATPGSDQAIVVSGGYYSQQPAITVTGTCTVLPSLAADGTFPGAVTGVHGVAPNYYGYGCSSVTLTVSSTYGSGAMLTPIYETQPQMPGIYADGHSAGGSMDENSVVAGSGEVIPYGFKVEAGNWQVHHDYCESVITCFGLGETQTSGINGVLVEGMHTQAANWPGFDMIDVGTASGGKVGLFAAADEGSGMAWLVRDPYHGVFIPSIPAVGPSSGWAGNGGQLGLYATTPGGRVLSTEPQVTSTISIGPTAPNCGSGCSSTNSPVAFVPAKFVNGDYQTMTITDTDIPAGIFTNVVPSASYLQASTATKLGESPLILDGAGTVGDYVVPSTTTVAPAAPGGVAHGAVGHDSGYSPSNPPFTNITTLGTIHDDKSSGNAVGFVSAPSGISCTPTGSGPLTVTLTFAYVTSADQTMSATDVVTVTGVPAYFSEGTYITCSGFASTPTAIYITSVTGGTAPTITANCGSDGGTTGLTISGTGGSGYTLPPTAVFTGGGFSTEPTFNFHVSGGAITGWDIVGRGAGCTGSATGTLTNNVRTTGRIAVSYSTSSVKIYGQEGDGTVPPAAGQIAPNIDVDIKTWPGITVASAYNDVPDFDFINETWTLDPIYAYSSTTDTEGYNSIIYTGTGSPVTLPHRAGSTAMTVTPNTTYTFTGKVDARYITAGTASIYICEPGTGCATSYLIVNQTNGQTGLIGGTITTGSGVTSLEFDYVLNAVTVSSGQNVVFSQPQLNAGQNAYLYWETLPPSVPALKTNALSHIIPATSGGGSAFAGGVGASYQDVTEIAAPADPASGNDRLYTDSSTHKFACLTSAGASCMPSGSGNVNAGAALANNQPVNGQGSANAGTGFTPTTAGTITAGKLACYTASNTVGNCTGTPSVNIIGVFNSSTTWIASGEASITLDGTVNVTAGDLLCASSTAGVSHDNGLVACATGEWVGVVKTTASSVSSATAFIALR